MHIASIEAQTTLNTYNLWKLALRGHLNTDARSQERCRNRSATAPNLCKRLHKIPVKINFSLSRMCNCRKVLSLPGFK